MMMMTLLYYYYYCFGWLSEVPDNEEEVTYTKHALT